MSDTAPVRATAASAGTLALAVLRAQQFLTSYDAVSINVAIEQLAKDLDTFATRVLTYRWNSYHRRRDQGFGGPQVAAVRRRGTRRPGRGGGHRTAGRRRARGALRRRGVGPTKRYLQDSFGDPVVGGARVADGGKRRATCELRHSPGGPTRRRAARACVARRHLRDSRRVSILRLLLPPWGRELRRSKSDRVT